jgi:hypothetical protein
VTVRALILSDTHLHAHRLVLPRAVSRAADAADVILHAGDVVAPELLEHLAAIAPTHAVLGNNDLDLVTSLPERRTVDVGGVDVAMVHDSGSSIGRAGRLKRWFPDAALVVFGHSHQPCDEAGLAGQRLFNPGSPTQRRRAPTHTFGWLETDGGGIAKLRIVDID